MTQELEAGGGRPGAGLTTRQREAAYHDSLGKSRAEILAALNMNRVATLSGWRQLPGYQEYVLYLQTQRFGKTDVKLKNALSLLADETVAMVRKLAELREAAVDGVEQPALQLAALKEARELLHELRPSEEKGAGAGVSIENQFVTLHLGDDGRMREAPVADVESVVIDLSTVEDAEIEDPPVGGLPAPPPPA